MGVASRESGALPTTDTPRSSRPYEAPAVRDSRERVLRWIGPVIFAAALYAAFSLPIHI